MTKTESMVAHALLLLLIAIISLVTRLIHALAIKINKTHTPAQNDPEVATPNKTIEHENNAQFHASENNVHLYARHSRILSPIDTDPQWDSYA